MPLYKTAIKLCEVSLDLSPNGTSHSIVKQHLMNVPSTLKENPVTEDSALIYLIATDKLSYWTYLTKDKKCSIVSSSPHKQATSKGFSQLAVLVSSAVLSSV